MASKNLSRIDKEGIFSHIYNKGIENKIIFNDSEDFEVFRGFLKDYLTPAKDPKSIKKDFKVNGQTFRGTPHQPKNYFNKVDLIAYSLQPDHFHLLVHQLDKGMLEKFIRSLCTRYSIYFNKKYNRSGTLFNGPYRSVYLNKEPYLLHLTRYFHVGEKRYSSYEEYMGSRQTSWVKPTIALSFLEKGSNGYREYLEKYDEDQDASEMIREYMLDNHTHPHHPQKIKVDHTEQAVPITTPVVILKPHPLKPTFIFISTTVYIVLVTLGIQNIDAFASNNTQPTVLSESNNVATKPTLIPQPTSEVTPPPAGGPEVEAAQIIKIIKEAANVNIRQKPSVSSKSIGKANGGSIFVYVSHKEGWYEILLIDGQIGFISEEFVAEE